MRDARLTDQRNFTEPRSGAAIQIAHALRDRVLNLTPADIHLDTTDRCPFVWGAMVETAHPDAVSSVTALADGSVSLYVSAGSGRLGCGMQREVKWAGAELLQIAGRSLDDFAPAADMDWPQVGYVRCYLLTMNGLYAAQAPVEELNVAAPRLNDLYLAGQRVVAAIELTGAGQTLDQEIKLALGLANASNQVAAAGEPTGEHPCLSVGNVVRRLRT
jgi:hypothetical protein